MDIPNSPRHLRFLHRAPTPPRLHRARNGGIKGESAGDDGGEDGAACGAAAGR